MAMQMQVAALLGSPRVGHLANGVRFFPSSFMSDRVVKQVGLRVKCMAEEGAEGEPKVASPSPTSTPTPSPPPTNPISSQKKANSTSFTDVFAFNGPAPERINGRLAMIGFMAAMAVELSKGTDLLSQISDGGAEWFIGTSILLSVASLVPLFKGERAESKTEGLMNSNAELWNGRIAMLGLIALAFTEFVKGGPLV